MRQLIKNFCKIGVFAVFMFVFKTPIIGQQKIIIKEGTADVGHFFIELLHNKPGAPMKSFSGKGGEIVVQESNNNFILRIRDLVWFEKEDNPDIIFNINGINPQTETKISFNKAGTEVKLQALKNILTDIHFSVQGNGKVKLSVPFEYQGGGSRFMQEFNVVTKSTIKTKSDYKAIWKALDKKDLAKLRAFITDHEKDPTASKYVEDARKAIVKLSEIDAAEKLKAEKESEQKKLESEQKKLVSDNKEISEPNKNAESTSKNKIMDELISDIQEVADNLNAEVIENTVHHNLSLIIQENEAKVIEIYENEMPLKLSLHQPDDTEDILINTVPIYAFTKDTTVTVNQSLLKDLKIKGDFTKYTLLNAFGTEVSSGSMSLNTEAGKKENTLKYMLGLGVLLIGFGGFVLFNRYRKEKRKKENKAKFQAKLIENQQQELVEKTDNIPSKVKHSGGKKSIKIGIGKKDKDKIDPVPVANTIPRTDLNSKIIIRTKKKAGIAIDYSTFVEIVNSLDTVNINLTKIWEDSRISNVYLTPKYIEELDNFLAESSNEGIQNELQGAIPEVGGFMMGRYSEVNDHLEVLIEKFVPFVPEYNDVFKIEIGTKTIVDELGDAQDKNPEMDVIGWFHTHPGHGLFLSTSDLSVQRHFSQDYQVAMEIDSLTKGLDMSIFTRKSTGRMNNSSDRKEGMGWFQWVDIDNRNVSKS